MSLGHYTKYISFLVRMRAKIPVIPPMTERAEFEIPAELFTILKSKHRAPQYLQCKIRPFYKGFHRCKYSEVLIIWGYSNPPPPPLKTWRRYEVHYRKFDFILLCKLVLFNWRVQEALSRTWNLIGLAVHVITPDTICDFTGKFGWRHTL